MWQHLINYEQFAQTGVAVTLGTEISADGLLLVQGTGQSLNQMSESDLKGINITLHNTSLITRPYLDGKSRYEHCEISIVRSREVMESQLKMLQVCAYQLSCIPNTS